MISQLSHTGIIFKRRFLCWVFTIVYHVLFPVQLFWAIGCCFVVLISIFIMPGLGWRYLLGIVALPLLIFALGCLVCPKIIPVCHVRYIYANYDKTAMFSQRVLAMMIVFTEVRHQDNYSHEYLCSLFTAVESPNIGWSWGILSLYFKSHSLSHFLSGQGWELFSAMWMGPV